MLPFKVSFVMGKIRRGGYIFLYWIGDHLPKHVHVYKDRQLIAKVRLDSELTLISGKINKSIRKNLIALVKEGLL